MTKEKIARINHLAKKSRESGLTEEEKEEQTRLRDEYRKAVIGNLTAELENTYIERPDGTKQRVHRVK